MRVGPSQKPSAAPSGSTSRPSTTTVAPSVDGDVDVARHLVAVRLGDEGPHVAGAASVAGGQPRHPRRDLLDQFVRDRVDRENDTDRHAPLARGSEPGVHGRVRDQVEVGIRKHQHVVLRPAERLHPLAGRGRRLVDVAGDRGRPDERDRLHVGVGEQRVDGLLVAVHDVEHAVGQARLLHQLRQPDRRRGVLLARLQHDGVAGRDRDREEPHRHHRRKVERADDAHDPERLAQRVDVDPGGHVLRVLALRQVGDAGTRSRRLRARARSRRAHPTGPCRVRPSGSARAPPCGRSAARGRRRARSAASPTTSRPIRRTPRERPRRPCRRRLRCRAGHPSSRCRAPGRRPAACGRSRRRPRGRRSSG